MVNKETKIYIAGHRGMVGSAVWRALEKKGYTNLLGKTSTELDLSNQQAVLDFYATEKPAMVIDAAARVGGILANTLCGCFYNFDLRTRFSILGKRHDGGRCCINEKRC